MKNIYLYVSTPVILALLFTGCQSSDQQKKVGIIVPMEHKAMNEIVSGFKDTLQKNSPVPVNVKVVNAQGDMNLQRAIIQQMKDEKYDIITPIGTTATQMTAASVQQQAIVSIAASFTQQERQQRKSCNIAIVHDEISSEQIIKFIHEVYPTLTRLTLVHSASDKVFPEVQESIAAGKKYGITVTPVMVQSLNELYSASNAIANNTQGIFILKDSLIVSGISTLALDAEKHHIPLITSDQGSVQDGAAFALGVHERDIGVEGAKLASAVLAGKSPCDLPIVNMSKLIVFVNKSSLAKESQSMTAIQQAAKNRQYTLEAVDSVNGS